MNPSKRADEQPLSPGTVFTLRVNQNGQLEIGQGMRKVPESHMLKAINLVATALEQAQTSH